MTAAVLTTDRPARKRRSVRVTTLGKASGLGLGVAVIPGLAVAGAPAGVEVRPLRTGAPVRRIAVAYPDSAYQPPVVSEMITILQEVTRQGRRSPIGLFHHW